MRVSLVLLRCNKPIRDVSVPSGVLYVVVVSWAFFFLRVPNAECCVTPEALIVGATSEGIAFDGDGLAQRILGVMRQRLQCVKRKVASSRTS